MQIGKVQGRTISEFGDPAGGLKRKISTDGKNRKELPAHLSSDPKALIGQWISGIDKIYRKPDSRKSDGKAIHSPTPSKMQFDARDDLGEAFWKLVSEAGLAQDSDYDQFKRRLHPYGDKFQPADSGAKLKFEADPPEPQAFHGRWYGAMSKRGNDAKELAAALYEHLHVDEKRIDGQPKRNPKTDKFAPGLVVARALGIESSVLPRGMARLARNWGEEEIQTYFVVDVAASVKEVAKAAVSAAQAFDPPRQVSGRSLSPKVGFALAEHLERVTGSKRCSFDPAAGPSVLALHDEVKKTYKRLCARGKNAARAFPADKTELLALMRHTHENRVRNQMVRMGRVSEYRGQQAGDLAQSHYWTSAGQTEIKESEIFVRLWVGAFALAGRSMKAWIDPMGKIVNTEKNDRDLTAAVNIRQVISNKEMVAEAMARRGIYFGETPELDRLGAEGNEGFVFALLRYLRGCRNQTFHLGARAGFLKEIRKELEKTRWGKAKEAEHVVLTDKTVAAIRAIIDNDAKALGARLLADLSGAFVAHYASKEHFSTLYSEIVKAVKDAPEVSSGLPRLKLLLKRADGVRGYVHGLRDTRKHAFATKLPPPPAPRELDDPATKARYIALLRLYDGPFRAYASGITGTALAGPAARAKEAATALAQSVNVTKAYSDVMEGRSSRLRPPNDGETLREYLSALTGETATEFRVQIGYESDSENARKQAEFIENYRRDMLAFMFEDYIRAKGFDWILKIEPGATAMTRAPVLPEPIDTRGQYEHWQAALYLVMHFVPASDVSNLLHQLRKWEALQGKYELVQDGDATDQADARREALDLVKRFRDVLVLFLKTGEARFEGRAAPFDLKPFRALFANPATFDRLFMATPTTARPAEDDPEGDGASEPELRVARTLRGLRQIARYNHMAVLSDLFAKHKVRDEEVARLAEIEDETQEKSQIVAAQELRTDLHDKVMKCHPKTISPEERQSYAAAIKTIEEHRFLVGRVYLGDHLRLHRLMMDVIGRLIDYAGAYERDTGTFLINASKQLGAGADWAVTIAGAANTDARTQTRKDLAHFNVLDRADGTPDLTALVNRAREMMAYDRKRKNAVPRSILDMLARLGLTLKWQMKDHLLQDATITQAAIKHLDKVRLTVGGPAAVTEARFSQDYLQMVAAVFNGSVQNPKPRRRDDGDAWHKPPKPATAQSQPDQKPPNKAPSAGSRLPPPQVGEVYEGVVVKVIDTGSLGFLAVEGVAGNIGLHISRLRRIREDAIIVGRRYRFRVEIYVPPKSNTSKLNAADLVRID
ncbi:type VI-A CRISPR-associated RNA-guided ribonuclease Cas13a [Rhodobacter capsulatus]|uniref:type VI-A CRISPR-associated RNA-guided ribonuclease Cas13a n=1 Tax=Rhodobacter capsulatus TaxID=1061 RepID=UPI0003D2BBFE|nr:type VI-A CRISPR-associated RNA-guided ribonuclease Cas13a [Rhodobacter capsulatus]ETD01877.1 hypothetical protein U714_11360 [Rhodobacter capsulatus DE442]ETD76934.1 hypothetical protein U717_11515 [Rhodobacter capsulatus R121]ETE53770.1 hypothetical protein U715_11520 [Rhodobacter capsulatus Y262]MDS0927481.1 type VI-A CRISPR-associated RNA-guided ribonuclease Cas13a [Rhodobacter capsulatus]TQD33705.1 hypothetical protein FKW81_13170 [Rhodobacter capsulatus]